MTDRQLLAEMERLRTEMYETRLQISETRIRHQQSVEEWESLIHSLRNR